MLLLDWNKLVHISASCLRYAFICVSKQLGHSFGVLYMFVCIILLCVCNSVQLSPLTAAVCIVCSTHCLCV